jgi:hypothetical protein
MAYTGKAISRYAEADVDKSIASRADSPDGNKVMPTTEAPSPLMPGVDPFDAPELAAPEMAAPTEDPGPPPASDSDVTALPSDQVGDIPPPPVPAPPPSLGPPKAAVLPGTFARPGSAAARPFRSNAYAASRPQRFGPGTASAGGGSAAVAGLGTDTGMGMSPEDAAELLARMARSGGQ